MHKITRSSLRQISYAEFGQILIDLTHQITASGIKFDLLVPILRSGSFTGMHLASKLNITNILPAQYKYVYEPRVEIIKKFDAPKLHFTLPAKPNILITDTNTVGGNLATHVINDVLASYPNARIYFAAAVIDASCKLNNVAKVFCGLQSNQSRLLTPMQAGERGIDDKILIFPWEDLQEEWEIINTLQHSSKT